MRDNRVWKVMPLPVPLDSLELASELISGQDLQRPESSFDRLGAHLWTVANAIRVWMETGTLRRGRLFERRRRRPELELLLGQEDSPGELRPACEAFEQMFSSPSAAAAGELEQACLAVAAWAEGSGKLTTALHFTELAARVTHVNPFPTNLAARRCREAGQSHRAEIWYLRAIGLSRRGKNTIEYINGHLGLATLLIEQGQYAEAMGKLRTAGSTARTAGLREQAAEAFHDAVYLATMEGDIAKATHYGRRANAAYPKKAKRYGAFGYDIGLLLVRAGMYGIAFRLLKTVVRKIPAPAEQLVVWGTLARAAAGAKLQADFTTAAAQVDSMAPTYRNTAAPALYSVAEGARLLGDWAMAEAYVHRALTEAVAVQSTQIISLAADLMAAIQNREEGPGEVAPDAVEGRALRNLAINVHQRVIRWSPKGQIADAPATL